MPNFVREIGLRKEREGWQSANAPLNTTNKVEYYDSILEQLHLFGVLCFQGGRFVFLLGVATPLEALKIFDRGHRRNKGAITYVLACMIATQAVGLYTVIWPQSGGGPVHRKTGSSCNGGLSQTRDVPLSVDGKLSAEYEKVEQGEVEVRSEKETD